MVGVCIQASIQYFIKPHFANIASPIMHFPIMLNEIGGYHKESETHFNTETRKILQGPQASLVVSPL